MIRGSKRKVLRSDVIRSSWMTWPMFWKKAKTMEWVSQILKAWTRSSKLMIRNKKGGSMEIITKPNQLNELKDEENFHGFISTSKREICPQSALNISQLNFFALHWKIVHKHYVKIYVPRWLITDEIMNQSSWNLEEWCVRVEYRAKISSPLVIFIIYYSSYYG